MCHLPQPVEGQQVAIGGHGNMKPGKGLGHIVIGAAQNPGVSLNQFGTLPEESWMERLFFPDFISFVGDQEPLQIMFFSQKKAPEQLSPGASSTSN